MLGSDVASLPTTPTVTATAGTVTVDGAWPCLRLINLGTTVVYARGDGGAAVAAADLNFAVPVNSDDGICLKTRASAGTLAGTGEQTAVSLISASGSNPVHVKLCEDC